MEFVDRIFRHTAYNEYLRLNAETEKDRQFCIHDLQHALDVARIAYIIALERKLDIDKEIIYMTALLHDIGRWKQYRYGLDHASEGALLAEEILRDIGVPEPVIEIILDAIRGHRKKAGNNQAGGKSNAGCISSSDTVDKKTMLSDLLYESDKACRVCTSCNKLDECNWYADGSKPCFKY